MFHRSCLSTVPYIDPVQHLMSSSVSLLARVFSASDHIRKLVVSSIHSLLLLLILNSPNINNCSGGIAEAFMAAKSIVLLDESVSKINEFKSIPTFIKYFLRLLDKNLGSNSCSLKSFAESGLLRPVNSILVFLDLLQLHLCQLIKYL
ncbi:Uncharacterised protein at_DN0536 [Pycnogonum litorale]